MSNQTQLARGGTTFLTFSRPATTFLSLVAFEQHAVADAELDPLFDALHGQRQSMRTYHTRHEQGSAYMALGYALASGKPGVFAVVPGPGILNATAALSTATASNAPVLGLTGQIPSKQIGLGLGIPHELRDQEMALRGVVPWVELAKAPAEAPAMLQQALTSMLRGRQHPAIFEMPPDIMARAAPVAVPTANADAESCPPASVASPANMALDNWMLSFAALKSVIVSTLFPPAIAVEFARRVLPHSVRPTFEETEKFCRAATTTLSGRRGRSTPGVMAS